MTTFTAERIAQLESFDGRGATILSTYLDLDPARQVQHSLRIVFEDLVREASESLGPRERAELTNEARCVRDWLENEPPSGRGLVLFSCRPRDLWLPYVLRVSVKDHLAIDAQPDVAPLLELIDEHERYAAAFVN